MRRVKENPTIFDMNRTSRCEPYAGVVIMRLRNAGVGSLRVQVWPFEAHVERHDFLGDLGPNLQCVLRGKTPECKAQGARKAESCFRESSESALLTSVSSNGGLADAFHSAARSAYGFEQVCRQVKVSLRQIRASHHTTIAKP